METSVVIRHFRDANALAEQLAADDELCLPSPALAELYYGAFRSDRPRVHLGQIERFLIAADVLTPEWETSRHYGQIAAQLSRKGTSIPQNDVWMAALAIQYEFPLATTDHHFQHVTGLIFRLW